jgi:serine/threonine-protein kinase
MQTLAAVAHAHSMGVVHRDLKPANIMLTESGAIKVMDFGIARVAGTEHLTNAGFMMGTPAYMAPEQVMGKEIDARADLYAIGVVFYRLTTGKLPFKGETPFAMAQSQVNDSPTPIGLFRADLPPWVEQIVVKALAKDPEHRFQSAVEFHDGFARSLAGMAMASPYTSSVPADLLTTPSRPMPSGALPRSITASYAMPTGPQPAVQPAVPQPTPDLGPTVLAPTPLATAAASSSGAVPVVPASPDPAMDATALAPSPTSSVSSSAAIPQQPLPSQPVPVVESPAPPAPKKGRSSLFIGAAAVVALLVIGFIGFQMLGANTPPATDATGATPSAPAVSEPPPAPPPVETPAASATAAATPTPTSTAPAPPRPVPTPTRAASAPSAPPVAAAPTRVIDDTVVSVADIKMLIVKGRNTNDQDVTLRFGDGEMALLANRGGAKVAAMSYASTLRATYTKARDPKWDAAIFGPPQNLDVGGPLRTSKHWLVLQATDSYLVLRLEDKNFRTVIQTVTARTNIPVDIPTSNEKP